MEKITIDQKNAGIRIDRFLAKEFFLYSRVDISKRIKKGEVLINNKQIKPSYILEEGNVIMLENFSKEAQDNSLVKNINIPLNVLFENEDIIVIDKQSGLQVHPSFIEKKNTLVNALLAYYPEILSVHDDSVGAGERPGIVHRLDRDTSGIMVIARNKKAFIALKKNFKDRKVEKQYISIAHGIFIDKNGLIEKPIAKSSSYKKQIIARSSTKTAIKSAETNFKVLEEFENYSLVELSPKTGRTHQLRIHLSSIGHPIVGDRIYGSKNNKIIDDLAKRQLLHAQKLKFKLFKTQYEFISPIPEDFNLFLAKISKKITL